MNVMMDARLSGRLHRFPGARRGAGGRVPAYIGFDARAKSLHVGSLIQIMMLRWLQKTGHKPICLMGGGTTKVGDPSGGRGAPLLDARPDRREHRRHHAQVFAKYVDLRRRPVGPTR
jgi:tyrosyl-tRNA synthetase